MASLSGFSFGDPAHARFSWRSTVRILEDEGPVEVHAKQLGRTGVLLETRLGVGRSVTLEMELNGERFQVLAHVETVMLAQGVALTLLRFGATSPRGNDLIAATVRHALEHPAPPVRFRPQRSAAAA